MYLQSKYDATKNKQKTLKKHIKPYIVQTEKNETKKTQTHIHLNTPSFNTKL